MYLRRSLRIIIKSKMEEVQKLLRGATTEYEPEESLRDTPIVESPQRWQAVIGYLLCASSVGVLVSSTWLISKSVASVRVAHLTSYMG